MRKLRVKKLGIGGDTPSHIPSQWLLSLYLKSISGAIPLCSRAQVAFPFGLFPVSRAEALLRVLHPEQNFHFIFHWAQAAPTRYKDRSHDPTPRRLRHLDSS